MSHVPANEPLSAKHRLRALMLGAAGVVYGDIGTSPLYAFHESFFGHHKLALSADNVLGVASMIFWSLFIVVGVKYIFFVSRADNHGEGGDFALLTLINSIRSRIGKRKLMLAWGLVIFSAALLLADGMITPAISVLSAVTGLEVLAPGLERYVIPITIAILVALFCVQPFGTHRIGRIFGPIMVVWFVVIALLAIPHIIRNPQVFLGINPWYAFKFFANHGWHTLFTLGSVVLVITGAEALYADMGHFGRRPIALAWWRLVFPCLMINYLGQAALLLTPGLVQPRSLFFSMVPPFLLAPMIILATCATIIASQALISGSFSLVQQAIALGAFPRQRIVHTNAEHEGQIYLPGVNWSLMVGCICLVLFFKTVTALAAAYGIAVTGAMTVTTIAFYLVASDVWRWPKYKVIPLCLAFFIIDISYFGANLLKFFHGGYVPIIMAIAVFSIMHSWHWGRRFIAQCYQLSQFSTVQNLIDAKKDPRTILLDRSIVVLASRPVSALTDTIPPALQSRLDHLGAVYKDIAILSVIQHPGVREMPDNQRFLINTLQDDPDRGSISTIQIFYGYMQDPDLSQVLPKLVGEGIIRLSKDPADRSFSILSGAERLIVGSLPFVDYIRLRLFRFLLRNANSVLRYFNLDSYPDVSTEVVNLGTHLQPGSWLSPKEDDATEKGTTQTSAS